MSLVDKLIRAGMTKRQARVLEEGIGEAGGGGGGGGTVPALLRVDDASNGNQYLGVERLTFYNVPLSLFQDEGYPKTVNVILPALSKDGVYVPARGNIAYVGDVVTLTDDEGGDRTVVEISAVSLDTNQVIIGEKIFAGTTYNSDTIELRAEGDYWPSLAFKYNHAQDGERYAYLIQNATNQLETNAAIKANGLYDGNNRVYSFSNPPPGAGLKLIDESAGTTYEGVPELHLHGFTTDRDNTAPNYPVNIYAPAGGGGAAFKGVRARNGGGQDVTSGWNVLLFPTTTFDEGGFHEDLSNSHRFQVPGGNTLNGYYEVSVSIRFASGAAAELASYILKNNQQASEVASISRNPNYGQTLQITEVLQLVSGDIVTIQALGGITQNAVARMVKL